MQILPIPPWSVIESNLAATPPDGKPWAVFVTADDPEQGRTPADGVVFVTWHASAEEAEREYHAAGERNLHRWVTLTGPMDGGPRRAVRTLHPVWPT